MNTTFNKDNIKKALESQAIRVTFTKRDGTERVMLCTRDFETLNANAEQYEYRAPVGKEAAVTLPDHMLRVWSLEDKDWRTINLNTMKSAEADS